MKRRRDPFQAVADPTRRAILVLLASQAMTAGDIAGHFTAARPTISKHMAILSQCELVESRQQGREVYYGLKAERMREIHHWLGQFKALWETRFSQLDELLFTLQKKESKNDRKNAV